MGYKQARQSVSERPTSVSHAPVINFEKDMKLSTTLRLGPQKYILVLVQTVNFISEAIYVHANMHKNANHIHITYVHWACACPYKQFVYSALGCLVALLK